MASVIGDVIHGVEIIVREQVDQMYRYLPTDVRKRRESALIEEAQRLFPWAPKKLTVSFGQTNTDYHYYLSVSLTVPDRARAAAVEERLRAAENTRCACGSYGSWDDSISGSSGDRSCVWAGCPNCSGSAIGRPILTTDLAWYERYAKKAVRS